MPDIDISKIEVGDRITLGGEFEVADVRGGSLSVRMSDGAPSMDWVISPAFVTAHHPKPKPLAVGDRVRSGIGTVYEIVGLKRFWEATGRGEYAMWSPAAGYCGIDAREVEKWERVS